MLLFSQTGHNPRKGIIMIRWFITDNQIRVGFDDCAVHIASDDHLKAFLKNGSHASYVLAHAVLTHYRELFGKPLSISRRSLAAEIRLHALSHDLFTALEKKSVFASDGLYHRFCRRMIRSAEVIDCGEKHVDGNRFVFDIVSMLNRK